jgi:hypothetical protein
MVLVDAFEAKGDTEEAKAYTKLLTEDNLKASHHYRHMSTLLADKDAEANDAVEVDCFAHKI